MHNEGSQLVYLSIPALKLTFGTDGPATELFGNLTLLDSFRALQSHPQTVYRDFVTQWLFGAARTSGGTTSLLVSSLVQHPTISLSYLPIVRCDVVNITRRVQHHFQSNLDGHKHTYTMHISLNLSETQFVYSSLGDPSSLSYHLNAQGVELSSVFKSNIYHILPLGHHANQHSIVSVRLFRDKDSFPIPYTSIYGITLISALRLGLTEKQRDKLFKAFLRMPLYEDMAPWNVVLMGQVSSYISTVLDRQNSPRALLEEDRAAP
jgi:hypothetical protein